MKRYLSNRVVRSYRFRRGASSLLVTVILSIVVVGMIAGLTLLSNQSSKQASNTDQSSRALNGAQTEVQVLADKVAADPSYTQSQCNKQDGTSGSVSETPLATSNGQDLAVTCATVTHTTDEGTGDIKQDKTVQMDLGQAYTQDPTTVPNPATDTVSSYHIEWGVSQNSTGAISPEFPVSSSWNSGRPAAAELTFISWPKKASTVTDPTGSSFRASDFSNGSLQMHTIVLPPTTGTYTNADSTSATVNCNAAPTAKGYNCYADGNFPNTGNVLMRITARYNDMGYLLSVTGSGGTKLFYNTPYATIDVTSRSGQTYRRVKATKPIGHTAFDFTSNVLYSGKNLCKDLVVYSDNTGAPAGNPSAGKNDCDATP